MTKRTTRMAMGGLLAACLAWVGLSSVAEAQINPRARPRFGAVNLRSGFMPDPHVVTGTMGGPHEARNIQGRGTCRGYVSTEPSHVINSRTGFRNIRFVMNGDRDSTLIVALPNGQILCDDDSGDGTHALIETSSPAGPIAVWVGAYSTGANGASYQLGITELSHVSANSLGGGGGTPVRPRPRPGMRPGGGINPNMPPAFGVTSLRSGFLPDPAIVSGTAGGPVQGTDVQSGCRGHVTPQPSHVLQAQSGFRNLRFIVSSSVDTTLVVMLPDGRILCNDDGGSGMNPLIETSSPAGPIRVWVGTYSSGRTAPYNLGFSELSAVTTANIPSPGGVPTRPGPGPVQPSGDVVQLQADIPVTLMGPGMAAGTVAMWSPSGGSATPIRMQGRTIFAGGASVASVPMNMRDPVITVTERRNGTIVVRAEQPPQGRRDRGQQILVLVRWQGGPQVADQWTGTATQRGPRWSR